MRKRRRASPNRVPRAHFQRRRPPWALLASVLRTEHVRCLQSTRGRQFPLENLRRSVGKIKPKPPSHASYRLGMLHRVCARQRTVLTTMKKDLLDGRERLSRERPAVVCMEVVSDLYFFSTNRRPTCWCVWGGPACGRRGRRPLATATVYKTTPVLYIRETASPLLFSHVSV